MNVVRMASDRVSQEKDTLSPRDEEALSTHSTTTLGPVYNLGMIGAIKTSGKAWRIPLLTNGKMVSYKVDTGAEGSLCPEQFTTGCTRSLNCAHPLRNYCRMDPQQHCL